jgi:predicted nucleic acid-binding protein
LILYLDASALIKRYFTEKGSRALSARFDRGGKIYTSLLTFGEVHAAMSRARRTGKLSAVQLHRIREEFRSDWEIGLSPVEVNVLTMKALPRLVEEYPLKAGDAIHLSTAFWLKDTLGARAHSGQIENSVEFGVADARLAEVAAYCGLQVFNPEQQD